MEVDRSLFPLLGRLRNRVPRPTEGTGQGGRRSNTLGAGVEFADHRAYHPGDDLRLVDWNAYARLETLLVRLFHEERNSRVLITLDGSASMGGAEPGKLDHAGSLAACLAFVGLHHRDRVSFAVAGGRPAGGRFDGGDLRALGVLLDLLGRTQPEGPSEPRSTLLTLAGKGRADRAYLISDMLFDEEAQQRTLRALASSARSGVLLHVLGEADRHITGEGEQELIDAESGERLRWSGGPNLQAALAEAEQLFRERLMVRCRDLGLLYIFCPTTTSISELLFRSLRRSGILEGSAAP